MVEPIGEESAEPELFPIDVEATVDEVMADLTAEAGCTFQPIASLYQDFSLRCRMRRIAGDAVPLTDFRRRFAMAVAGYTGRDKSGWTDILRVARPVPDDLLAPFLVIARAARDGEVCPDDDELARIYGTSSPGRVRRLLEHYEKSGLIVVRTDFGGRRSIGIPELGLTTAPL
jgi:hypothetical protein